MKLTDEEKAERKDMREFAKQCLKEDLIKKRIVYNDKYRTSKLFSDTNIGAGGFLIGHKWMTAKELNKAETRWVNHSYDTRTDNVLKRYLDDKDLIPYELDKLREKLSKPLDVVVNKLKEIDGQYDLSAGCGQCGGCRFFAALDGDYGICCNELSPNDGRVTFEHGGCIQHSFIQELLNKDK
jgi:hypothetical protein